jgi:hypothetical protein
MRRVWPAAKGIAKPSGAVLGSPCTAYVQKLWYLRCSPSVMTGEPVASKRATVSATAASYIGSRDGSSGPRRSIWSRSSVGRGMLPTGSVGISNMAPPGSRQAVAPTAAKLPSYCGATSEQGFRSLKDEGGPAGAATYSAAVPRA